VGALVKSSAQVGDQCGQAAKFLPHGAVVAVTLFGGSADHKRIHPFEDLVSPAQFAVAGYVMIHVGLDEQMVVFVLLLRPMSRSPRGLRNFFNVLVLHHTTPQSIRVSSVAFILCFLGWGLLENGARLGVD